MRSWDYSVSATLTWAEPVKPHLVSKFFFDFTMRTALRLVRIKSTCLVSRAGNVAHSTYLGGYPVYQIGMRRPVSRGMRYAPNVRRARGTKKRRPAMQKISTMRTSGKNIFEGQLTIGLDLGDRSSAQQFSRETTSALNAGLRQ